MAIGTPEVEVGGMLNGAGGVGMGMGALMWGWRPPILRVGGGLKGVGGLRLGWGPPRLRVGGPKWGWGRRDGAGGSYVGMETPQVEGRGL